MNMPKLIRMVVTVALTALMLASCSNTKLTPDATMIVENSNEPIAYMPIDEYVNLSENFFASARDIFLDGTEKHSMTCAHEQAEVYIQSDESIAVTSNTKNLIICCTWNPQDRNVYIGLRNTETGIFYILPSTGGAVSGKIKLDDMPDGEYRVVMCSNDNPSIVAALWFQIA